MSDQNWVVIPYVDLPDMTIQAAEDVCAQTLSGVRLLLVDNGSSAETRRKVRAWHEDYIGKDQVWFWHHNPALPSLDSTWNRALDFVWGAGGEHCWVVNNDVRLHRKMYEHLLIGMQKMGALFITGVGVKEDQFYAYKPNVDPPWADLQVEKGGPDFSCFLISRACHLVFRFDNQLTWFGDNDYHYRMKLAGKGDLIFGVNVPYLHYAAQTIQRSPEITGRLTKVFEANKQYYLAKWGGLGGQEKFKEPFDGKE